MSLRLRLFMLIGGLIVLLVIAQQWWARMLARDLSTEIDQLASSVGHSVATFFSDTGLHSVAPAAHKVIECRGTGCADLVILDSDAEDPQDSDAEDPQDEVEPGKSGRRPISGESRVVIRRFHSPAAGQSSQAAAGSASGHAYVYSHGDATAIKAHLNLHIEHEGEARYLLLAGPKAERRIRIPQGGVSDQLARFSQRLLFGSVGLLALGLAMAGWVAHRVTVPLRQLSDASRRLGEGDLGTRISPAVGGEVGRAIDAFNRMSGRLEELDRRNRELSAQKHLSEIGEISRGLAHTLRNPLNALGLSVDALATGDETAGASQDLAEAARRQIRRIDTGLKSFLALASQGGGVLDEVDLGELVEDVVLEALQDCQSKVRLDLGSFADLPRLRVVEAELRAVLQALVVNAMEASPQNGRVSVRGSAPVAGRWRLEIDDQGPGLPEKVRDQLFTPHLSTKPNGSGMGLFLAHRIASTRYQGRLQLIDLEAPDGGVGGTRAVLEIEERAGVTRNG